jgi:DNA-3-methyladenine glycosylase
MSTFNATMYGPPGRLYVYFTYGNHWMMNAVTGGDGEPSAVLLRAVEPTEGMAEMAARRGRSASRDLCSGPGKLTQALGVGPEFDGTDLVRGGDVWIEAGAAVDPGAIAAGVRVGVSAGLDRNWRFIERGNAFVSKGRPGPPHRSPPRSSRS